jgi:hypothetical protein
LTTEPESIAIGQLVESLPTHIGEAAIYCSLPHYFDLRLGLALVKQSQDGQTDPSKVLTHLLSLPFIYRHGEDVWQYTGTARDYFTSFLLERSNLLIRLSDFLAHYLQERWDALIGTDQLHARLPTSEAQLSLELRQLQWQLAYHTAPVRPEEAIRRLLAIADWAGLDYRRQADRKLAIDVLHSQAAWLGDYPIETAYLDGQYAYSRRKWQLAESKLNYVWNSEAKNPLLLARAGHLLGVIRRRKGEPKAARNAEAILRRTLALCDDEIHRENEEAKALAARITNSLGATLTQIGGRSRLDEAAKLLRRSLELHEAQKNQYGAVHALHSLGVTFMRRGGAANFREAEASLRLALATARQHNYSRTAALVAVSLAQLLTLLGGDEYFTEAKTLLRSSLETATEWGDERQQAVVSGRLGRLLSMFGGRENLREAETLSRQSQITWHQLGNSEGEYEALQILATVLERLGRRTEAETARNRAARIRESRNSPKHTDES